MTTDLRRAGQVAWAIVGMAVVVAMVGLVVIQVKVIIPPLILASAIVFVLNPVVTALQRRGVPRAAGAGLTYLAGLALVAGLGAVLWPLASRQVDALADEVPTIRARLERWVDDRAEDSKGTLFEFSRQDLEGAFSGDGARFEDQLRQLRRIGGEVVHVVLVLVLAPIIAFYLLVDVPHLRRVAESLVPPPAREEVLVVASRLNRAIGGFFRGQLVVALIVGVICSIGLAAIGLEFWFLIGMIAGLFNVIPLIGPWVGGIPGVAVALTTGSPLQAAGVVGVMVAAQQIDNHFITPQVMQRTVQLHPAVVILALVAGGARGGFFGLLVAVPLAAVLKIVVSHLWRVHVLGQPLASALDDHGEAGPDPGPGGAPPGAGDDGAVPPGDGHHELPPEGPGTAAGGGAPGTPLTPRA